MNNLPAWAMVGPKRLAHVERVVGLLQDWAERMALDPHERSRWLRAGWLHDALRDAPVEELRRLAPDATGPVTLLHGPASAARAAAAGESDPGVLSAVRYHSLGFAGWDAVGHALYCADYLDPARRFDRPRRAALAVRYPDAPLEVLRQVAAARVGGLVGSGWPLPELTVAFWNRLADRSAA